MVDGGEEMTVVVTIIGLIVTVAPETVVARLD